MTTTTTTSTKTRSPRNDYGRAQRRWVAVARRRAWVVILCAALVAGLAGVLSQVGATTYSATATLTVPTVRPGESFPANIDNAVRLASVYGEVLPRDPALVNAAASRLGLTPSQVRGAVSVRTAPRSPLLYVAFRASTAPSAVEGARVVAELATTQRDPAGSITPGTLRALELPQGSVRSGSAPSQNIPFGLLVGAVLGGVLAMVAERLNQRVDSSDDLIDLTRCPVTVLDHPRPEALSVLFARWQEIAAAPLPVICLMSAETGDGRRMQALGKRLRDIKGTDHRKVFLGAVPERRAHRLAQSPAAEHHATLVVAGAPGTAEAGELVGLASDGIVVVVFNGARRSRVERSLASLDQSGVTPMWLLLVPDGRWLPR